jgi:hypothetical protein
VGAAVTANPAKALAQVSQQSLQIVPAQGNVNDQNYLQEFDTQGYVTMLNYSLGEDFVAGTYTSGAIAIVAESFLSAKEINFLKTNLRGQLVYSVFLFRRSNGRWIIVQVRP